MLYSVFRNSPATALQAVDDVEHGHRVFHLVVSEQLDAKIPALPVVEDLPVDRPRASGEGSRICGDEARRISAVTVGQANASVGTSVSSCA